MHILQLFCRFAIHILLLRVHFSHPLLQCTLSRLYHLFHVLLAVRTYAVGWGLTVHLRRWTEFEERSGWTAGKKREV